MRTALRAKTKLGFIDGSIRKPALQSEDFYQWEKADSMVMAWIINSTDPSLHGSISHASTAKDVWLDLEERFAQTNAPRIHQLWRTLCLMQKQSDVTVTEFYTQFKSLLDELDELQPLPECSCGASKQLIQREEDRRVHLFLGGFDNEQYAHVKATILNSEPMPPLRRVFNHIQREESRFAAEKEREVKIESGGAFYSSKGNKHKSKDGPRPRCDHCGKIGHVKAKCFEIIGYPANWETRRTQYGQGKQGEQSSAHMAHAEEGAKKENVEAPTAGRALHGMNKGASNMASKCKEIKWVLDSGASHHMTPLLFLFDKLRRIEKHFSIITPTGSAVMVETMGDISLDKNIFLKDVLFIPDFSCNLISIHRLTQDLDCTVTYDKNCCVMQDLTSKRTIGLGDLHDGVYVFKGSTQQGHSFIAAQENTDKLWHSRLGHPSAQALRHLSSFLDCDFNLNKFDCCDICHKSKHCRSSFHLSNNKAEAPFNLVHCDVWGKYHTASHNGAHYFLTIVDDYTRGTWVYLMKDKTETVTNLINFCRMVKRQFNVNVRRIRSDNGTEFINSAFQKFLLQEGILQETSCVATPQQNGRVERKHRHILNVARALRFEANLPIHFWGECILAATHLINRTPTVANKGVTPYQMLYGKAPNYAHLRVIGCLCYVKSTKKLDKFAPRSEKCVFIGYPQGQKGWKVFNLETHEFIVSRDVIFHEHVFPYASPNESTFEAPYEQRVSDVTQQDDEEDTLLQGHIIEHGEPSIHDAHNEVMQEPEGPNEEEMEVQSEGETQNILEEEELPPRT